MRIAYSPEWSDDEWRENNFSNEQRTMAASLNARQPSADELIKAANRFGPEGILESAIMLRQYDFKKVEDALKKVKS